MRAAQALESAFAQVDPTATVQHVDVLQYTNPLFRRLYSKAYIDMVNNAPDVLGWLYDRLDEPWQNERLRLAFSRLNTRPLVKMLEKFSPDLVLSTHFLPSEIVSWLKSSERMEVKHGVVVTDIDVHSMWLCRSCEHYYVAAEETRAHLIALGVPAEHVVVSGIPIDPIFAETPSKEEMRAKLGLLPNRKTILVSAGGFGVGPIERLIESLLQLETESQLVVICGKNESLKERLQHVVGRVVSGRVSAHLIGYTKEMHNYMSASDLIVGKPGGLTTSEALAKGLVMVIVNPIPGQEERNSDHLLEEGVAIRCNNLPALSWKIDRLLQDEGRFERMRANVARVGRPHAAIAIAQHALGKAR